MKFNFLNKMFARITGKKEGFTLAELMIVLAVLAVISAILLPAAFNSMPDENKLKFKKGYYTLKRTVDALVNSEAYQQTEGNFGEYLADETTDTPKFAGEITAEAGNGDDKGDTYFCVQFSEMLNSTETQCSNFLTELQSGVYTKRFDVSDITGDPGEGDDAIDTLDTKCSSFMATANNANVVTQDGIYWALPKDNFSGDDREGHKWQSLKGYSRVPAYYAVICMDVDGIGGEAAFGFGIRHDGKVIAGQRAKQWLQEGTTNVVPAE